jgi:hypothetical protein
VTTGHAAWSEVQTTILMDYLYNSFNTDSGSRHIFKDITYNAILPVINEWHEKGPQKTLVLCKSKYNGVSHSHPIRSEFHIIYHHYQLAADWKNINKIVSQGASGLSWDPDNGCFLGGFKKGGDDHKVFTDLCVKVC